MMPDPSVYPSQSLTFPLSHRQDRTIPNSKEKKILSSISVADENDPQHVTATNQQVQHDTPDHSFSFDLNRTSEEEKKRNKQQRCPDGIPVDSVGQDGLRAQQHHGPSREKLTGQQQQQQQQHYSDGDTTTSLGLATVILHSSSSLLEPQKTCVVAATLPFQSLPSSSGLSLCDSLTASISAPTRRDPSERGNERQRKQRQEWKVDDDPIEYESDTFLLPNTESNMEKGLLTTICNTIPCPRLYSNHPLHEPHEQRLPSYQTEPAEPLIDNTVNYSQRSVVPSAYRFSSGAASPMCVHRMMTIPCYGCYDSLSQPLLATTGHSPTVVPTSSSSSSSSLLQATVTSFLRQLASFFPLDYSVSSVQVAQPEHQSKHHPQHHPLISFERYRNVGPFYSSRRLTKVDNDYSAARRRLPSKRWRGQFCSSGGSAAVPLVKTENRKRGRDLSMRQQRGVEAVGVMHQRERLESLDDRQQHEASHSDDEEDDRVTAHTSQVAESSSYEEDGTLVTQSHFGGNGSGAGGGAHQEMLASMPEKNLLSRRDSISIRSRQTRKTSSRPLLSTNLRSGSGKIARPARSDGSDTDHGRRSRSWRQLVVFHQVRHYVLERLSQDLKSVNVPCDFVDEKRSVLSIDGDRLFSRFPLLTSTCPLIEPCARTSALDRSMKETQESEVMLGLRTFDSLDSSQEGGKESGLDEEIHVYVFELGVVVLWGLTEGQQHQTEEKGVSRFLSSYSDSSLPFSWRSKLCMSYCKISDLPSDVPIPLSRVHHERLYMKANDREEQVAASLALAQSTRLTAYEEAVEDTIQRFSRLPLRLASKEFHEYMRYGETDDTLIRKGVAEVYSIVINVNVVEDFLDVPEYFWHREKYQPFWHRIHRYLDIYSRIQILNVRVGYIQEILKVISNERVEAQGFHLTWVVIILLVMNVSAIVVREILDRRR